MFKPNRVGTPTFHSTGSVNYTGAWTINLTGSQLLAVSGNVINASPAGIFDHICVTYQGTPKAITNGNKWALLYQYSIQKPLAGNTVGFDANFGVSILCSNLISVEPIVCKLNLAGGATLAAVSSIAGTTRLGEGFNPNVPTANGRVQWNHYAYKEQFAVYDPTDLSGVYAHGLMFVNNEAAPLDVSGFHASAAIRQLSDTRLARYQDPYR